MRGRWSYGDVIGLACWVSVVGCAAEDRAPSSLAVDVPNEAASERGAALAMESAPADDVPRNTAPVAAVDRGASSTMTESSDRSVGAISALGAADEGHPASALDAGLVAVDVPEPDPEPPAPPEPEPARALSFESDIHPLLAQQCGPCHTTRGTAGHNVGGPLPRAYRDALELGQLLLDRIDGGGMPPACDGNRGAPGCFSVAEVELVQSWLDQGSPP